MKIREIREGLLDRVLGKSTDTNTGDQQRVTLAQRIAKLKSDSGIKRIGSVATKAWAGRTGQIMKKMQNALTPQQYDRLLRKFIDETLMGNVSLNQMVNKSVAAKKVIDRAVNNIITNRGDPAAQQDAFTTISAMASTWVDTGLGTEPTPDDTVSDQGIPTPDEAKPFRMVGSKANLDRLELDTRDPSQKQLYNKLKAEYSKDNSIAR